MPRLASGTTTEEGLVLYPAMAFFGGRRKPLTLIDVDNARVFDLATAWPHFDIAPWTLIVLAWLM